MACVSPLNGWASRKRNASGKRSIVFRGSDALVDRPVSVPCGRCIGCRLDKSAEWAARAVHESALHQDACFLTLTYSDEHLPHGGTLVKSHLQNFNKLLRYHLRDRKVRYLGCGEYGEHTKRPHYHELLFGYRPDDLVKYSSTLSTSAFLESIWKFGSIKVGELTFESAAYTARYTMKKMYGPPDVVAAYYDGLTPEFLLASQSLGVEWARRNWREFLFDDLVVLSDGRKMNTPKAYLRALEEEHPDEIRRIRSMRVARSTRHADDNTQSRLNVKEAVLKAALNLKRRSV